MAKSIVSVNLSFDLLPANVHEIPRLAHGTRWIDPSMMHVGELRTNRRTALHMRADEKCLFVIIGFTEESVNPVGAAELYQVLGPRIQMFNCAIKEVY